MIARRLFGWPKICKLDHAFGAPFLWECSYKRSLKLAQLLSRHGVSSSLVRPVAAVLVAERHGEVHRGAARVVVQAQVHVAGLGQHAVERGVVRWLVGRLEAPGEVGEVRGEHDDVHVALAGVGRCELGGRGQRHRHRAGLQAHAIVRPLPRQRVVDDRAGAVGEVERADGAWPWAVESFRHTHKVC
jgi:hypothetical protein